MSEFSDRLEEYIGNAGDVFDIRAVVRRCWFYDFDGYPIRIWSGQGRLFTSDGHEWMGSVDSSGKDVHSTPALRDSRDGTSPEYKFSFGYVDAQIHAALKADSWRVRGRMVTCYLAIFELGEGLRPGTPIDFLASYEMKSTIFEEALVKDERGGRMVRRYKATVIARDANSGRSRAPGGTYTSTSQRERARRLGVSDDKGCDFVAGFANKTYLIP